MRYRDLTEAPIDQYAAVGDWDDPKGSFRSSNRADLERSHTIIHSSVAVQKIRSAWAKVPQKFNFWMVNDTSTTRVRSHIYSIEDFRNDPRFEPYASDINPTSDTINVIYTSNFTVSSNYKPMTAWIMAHRLVHALQMTNAGGRHISAIYGNIESELAGLISDTLTAYGIYNRRGHDMLGISLEGPMLKPLISKLFTMRSARMGKLHQPLDLPAEMLAQHLLSGGIRFNPLPPSMQVGSDDRRGVSANRDAQLDPRQADQLNARWQEMASTCDQRFDELLDKLVGKVIVL